jgi:hypothetical protein
LSLCERAADPKLVRDGRITLIVRRVPRVDADLQDFTSVENFRLAARLAFEQLASRLPREHSYEPEKRSSPRASIGAVAMRRTIRGVRDGDG